LAALVGLAFVVACGGTEELALNPLLGMSVGGAGGTTMTPAGGSSSGSSVGGSQAEATAGTSSDSSSAGGPSQAGQGPSSCSGDLQCSAPTPRCSDRGSCVACVSDDDCPRDGARRCNEQGRCVACVDNEDCGDNLLCEALTGTCQACASADCASSAGGSSDGGNP
jgi:hypothetical protein